jgi:probable addiction module antidote protein
MAPKKKALPYDAAEFLDSEEAIAAYVTEAFHTEDHKLIAHALGVAARAKGMSVIAEATGLSRESLYRALSADGHPQFETIERVLSALGLKLRAEPAKGKRVAPTPKGKKAA